MKSIAAISLILCLPIFADELAITIGKDGALSVAGKGVDESACTEALKSAADKVTKDRVSALRLTLLFAPETHWGPVQRRINQAAELGVWDIRLTIQNGTTGDKTIEIPLPKDSDLGDGTIFFPDEEEDDGEGEKKDGKKREARRIPEEIRAIVWTGKTGDIAKDLAADPTKQDPDPASVKTWARVNTGPAADISSDPSAVLESLRERLKAEQAAGTKNPAAILDIASSVSMKHVFSLASGLKDPARGSWSIEFAMPLRK